MALDGFVALQEYRISRGKIPMSNPIISTTSPFSESSMRSLLTVCFRVTKVTDPDLVGQIRSPVIPIVAKR